MKYFLVYRNESLENEKVVSFQSKEQAIEVLKRDEKIQKGEVVLVAAKDLKSMFLVYGEYRPANWESLLRKGA
jgi:hypothetical protein